MSESSPAVSGRRIPALDGLRAFAVLGVMAYHLGLGWASGGYLGVDLFFVLSGFLITSLLVEERRGTGRIRLGAFWGRRARRLLPALFLVLIAVALYAWLNGRLATVATGGAAIDLSGLRGDAFATLFYVANWHLVLVHQSYFAQFSAPSPLQHTWSLAIEEQFYVIWPLVVVAIYKIAPRRWRTVGIAVAVVGAAASAIAMAVLYHAGSDPSRVYYGSDTRAFDILIGATLAMLVADRAQPGARARWALHGAGPLAVVALGAFWLTAGTSSGQPTSFMFQGGFLLCAVLAAVVLADVRQSHQGPLAKVLSLPPLRWIGSISYGLYLWHWPVVVYLNTPRTGLSGFALDAARIATTFAVATASYYLIELPVRERRLSRASMRAFVPGTVVATVAIVLLGTTPSLAGSGPTHVWRGGGLAPGSGAGVPGVGGIAGEKPITLPRGVRVGPQNKLRILTIGDSVMRFAEQGITASLRSTGDVTVTRGAEAGWGLEKPGALGGLMRNVQRFHPQLLMGTWSWDNAKAAADPQAYEQFLDKALRRLLNDDGVQGVIFLQMPAFGPGVGLYGQDFAQDRAGVAPWNAIVAHAATMFPGKVMYLPVASALEIDGQYTSWLPALGTPSTSLAHWVRVRSDDEVHLCPPGITRYAEPILEDLTSLFHLGRPLHKWWISGSVTAAGFANSGSIGCPDDHPSSWSALPAGAAALATATTPPPAPA